MSNDITLGYEVNEHHRTNVTAVLLTILHVVAVVIKQYSNKNRYNHYSHKTNTCCIILNHTRLNKV